MGLFKSADKLLKNKVVLYVVLFLTITNVFGYLMVRNYEAIVFFALVAYISSEFTKNNILICAVAMLMTNLLLAIVQGRKVYESMRVREGMNHENPADKAADGDEAAPAGEAAPADEPVVDETATKQGFTNKIAPSLSTSKMNEHMANLDRIEGLLNKQEGLVGSLSKIESMMSKLEKMGAKPVNRRND